VLSTNVPSPADTREKLSARGLTRGPAIYSMPETSRTSQIRTKSIGSRAVVLVQDHRAY
jgi:hypothetical protein